MDVGIGGRKGEACGVASLLSYLAVCLSGVSRPCLRW
jgi:hypothetical protein